MERFRSFLLAFYTQKLGYYPPREFGPSILSIMFQDFSALYDLLVDDGCAMPAPRPNIGGSGGLCMLQLLQAFDRHNHFDTQRHPLPLLPEVAAQSIKRTPSRRTSWLPTARGERGASSANSKLLAHTALIRASNWRERSFKNDLVRAYREYEGQTIVSPNPADKRERVSLVDARKVRWILIYTTYQVLRSVALRPVQVDGESAPYHLTATVDDLPPVTKHLEVQGLGTSGSRKHAAMEDDAVSPTMAEIKPDIDYFALTHREPQQQQQPQQHTVGRRQSVSAVPDKTSRPLSRSESVTRMLTRSSTLRKSFRRFKSSTPTGTPEVVPPARRAYHEIVVHGYGNGTNDVNVDDASAKGKVGAWVAKPALASATAASEGVVSSDTKHELLDQAGRRHSQPAESRVSHRPSNASSVTTLDTDKLSSPASPSTESSSEFEQQQQQQQQQQRSDSATAEPVIVRNSSHKSLTQRYPMRTVLESIGRTSSMRRSSVSGKDSSSAPTAGMLARGPSFRKSLIPESWTLGGSGVGGRACESDIDEEDDVLTALQAEAEEDWAAMQSFLDEDGTHKMKTTPAWEQYADLGGLTEMR